MINIIPHLRHLRPPAGRRCSQECTQTPSSSHDVVQTATPVIICLSRDCNTLLCDYTNLSCDLQAAVRGRSPL